MAHLNLEKIHIGVFKTLYRGISMQKFPFDYVMYQMIMSEVKPDLVIEIGTMHGGSALYFADLMDILKIEGGEVHTIDIVSLQDRKEAEAANGSYIPPNMDLNYPEIVSSHPRIKCFFNGYEEYDLSNCEGFKKILVIDDGSHKYEDVLSCLNKFKDVVGIGSYFIVEDGNAYDLPFKEEYKEWLNGGPLRAIFKFLSTNSDNFGIDYRWCDMFGINSTYNTYGYIKRNR
jgi:cephalosporin hydroxylase